ncbi:MAG: hypothetical protein ACOVO2_08620 [Emticicia sp.]
MKTKLKFALLLMLGVVTACERTDVKPASKNPNSNNESVATTKGIE